METYHFIQGDRTWIGHKKYYQSLNEIKYEKQEKDEKDKIVIPEDWGEEWDK